MKKILITGSNSYIGTSFENWLMREPDKYEIDTIDMRNESWKEKDFSQYDVIFHVAGIVHQKVNNKKQYLYVNVNLPIEIAKKAKSFGVKQFIFMSSMSVYKRQNNGKTIINKDTVPGGSNLYGYSKLQAEKGIKDFASDDFKIAILRPPMIYGKSCKGNYPRLSKIATMIPVFPDINNKRSMLHIDNLCEFIKVIIDFMESGIFFPQNKEYVKTSELVKIIAELHGKKIFMTRIFNPFIRLILRISVINKLFGDFTYEKYMSEYGMMNYQIRSFKESIELTEL